LTELGGLIDTDPAEAVLRARLLKIRHPKVTDEAIDHARASILIDAGTRLGLAAVVQEGVEILRPMHASHPERFDVAYNLANGIMAIADLEAIPKIRWFLLTRKSRQEARRIFHAAAVASRETHPETATQALCNLGNALRSASRWCEAYTVFADALRVYPRNGVAALNAALMLDRMSRLGVDDPEVLRDLAQRYAGIAKREIDTVRRFAGSHAAQRLESMASTDQGVPRLPTSLDPYQRFVAENGLALCPTIEGVDWSRPRWDSAHLAQLVLPTGSGPGVPPLFAMFNVVKSDFLLARDIAYDAMREEGDDTGLYFDTLDYATYGRRAARLTLALRSAFDLLDRIATLLNEYLELGLAPKDVAFHKLWSMPKQHDAWHPRIEAALAEDPRLLAAEAQSLLALAELSVDVGHEGYLKSYAESRNTATHRFTVLHDFGMGGRESTPVVAHADATAYGKEVIEVLRLARAAILYLAHFINVREERRAQRAGLLGSLHVPTHDWVRGTGEHARRDASGESMGSEQPGLTDPQP
jgi:hypothetical protein